MARSKSADDLLIEEYRQAWEHYRHLENGRTWALGFFSTIAVGSIGGLATIFETLSPRANPDVYLGTHVLVFAVGMLAITIYLRVRKTAFVLRHYVRAWRHVRLAIYADDYEDTNARLDVFENPAITSFSAGETATTHWLLLASAGICSLYLASGAFQTWPHIGLPDGRQIIVWLLMIVLITYGIWALRNVRRANAQEDLVLKTVGLPNKPLQPTSGGQSGVE